MTGVWHSCPTCRGKPQIRSKYRPSHQWRQKRKAEVLRPIKSVSKEKQTKTVSKKPGRTPRGRLNLRIILNSSRCRPQVASHISACIFFMWGKNVMGCHYCPIGWGKCDIATFFLLRSLRNKWRCNIKN